MYSHEVTGEAEVETGVWCKSVDLWGTGRAHHDWENWISPGDRSAVCQSVGPVTQSVS